MSTTRFAIGLTAYNLIAACSLEKEFLMKSLTNIAVCSLLLACGPVDTGGDNSGGDTGPTADAGSPEDAGPPAVPTLCDLYRNDVFTSCTGCHGAQGGVGIDLSSPQALHDSLVGQSGNSRNPMVVSGDAEASWLWVRMSEAQGQGSMPPAGKRPLDDRNAVRDWINSGNLDDCL
jgi:hypothetical protein